MDAARFDTLARHLGAPRSRRAALGAVAASGLLGALGLARSAPEVQAAQGGTCVLAFAANVRLGPGMNQVLTTNEALPGELRGQLAFALSQTGSLQNAAITLPDGSSLPVVGQATGTSLQLRIGLNERVALVAVGVGEQDVAACEGAIDGVATGPNVGDLGDWHAVAVSRSNASGESGTGQAGRGGKKNGGKDASGGAPGAAGAAGGEQTGRTGRGGGSGEAPPPAPPATGTTGPAAPTAPSGPSGPTGASSTSGTTSAQVACASGTTRCGDVCVDMSSDAANCSACGITCAAGDVCRGSLCVPANGGGGCSNTSPTHCGTSCANLMTDPKNCGACGVVCGASQNCQGGVCTDCPAGQSVCRGSCVDLQTDPVNCGVCGTSCLSAVCQGGACATCEDLGTADCGTYCADLLNDVGNCGTCGNFCASGVCSVGQCVDDVGPSPHACAQPGESCTNVDCCVGFCDQDEICECVADGGECAQTGTGGCCTGQPCNADGFCGTCRLFGVECNADADCCSGGQYGAALCCFDGVSLTTRCTDVTNIGFVCPGEPTGPVTCAAGLTDCGGECVDLSSNAGNCGVCGTSCGLGGVCTGGVCGPPPPTCLVNGSPCTFGVDVCCAGLTCYASICQCSPPGDVCGDPTVCCSGVCNGDGFCD